jgi:hypothetical protein
MHDRVIRSITHMRAGTFRMSPNRARNLAPPGGLSDGVFDQRLKPI